MCVDGGILIAVCTVTVAALAGRNIVLVFSPGGKPQMRLTTRGEDPFLAPPISSMLIFSQIRPGGSEKSDTKQTV